MSKFIHLHNHTDHSILDGAVKIKDYVSEAKAQNMEALAITDHGNMFGVLSFAFACKSAGIKPIIGCEFYVSPEGHTLKDKSNKYYHLILLCQNKIGYKNMIKLNSIGYTEGYYYKPRISDELLEKYNEGIVCLSACVGGEIPQLLLHSSYAAAKKKALYYKNLFKDRYFIEIQNHGITDEDTVRPLLIKLAKDCDIPLVATNDVHYLKKEHANAHDTLIRIGRNMKKSDPAYKIKQEEEDTNNPSDTRDYSGNLIYRTPEFYLKTENQMIELFKDIPEAISNTKVIADMCNYEHHSPGPILPLFEIPDGFKDEKEYLRHVANEGLRKRYNVITPELQERLDYELDTINDPALDFPGYFLIVWDFIRWARENKIAVGPGRGSGAGSLVAYAMTITDIDPIKYGLLFERFLNKERVSMPDFDIDFCKRRRGEVIDYVTEHYGKEKVAQIVAYGTLKAKAILKDVARVLDIPLQEVNQLTTKIIPDELPLDPNTGKAAKINIPNLIKFVPEINEIYEKGNIYKEWFDTATTLENNIRQLGTHAAGVVIGREEITQYVPAYVDRKTGAVSTQFDKHLIEDEGLVKMDFLGLSTLTLIEDTIELIHKNNPDFDITKIDEQDEATFKMLCAGNSEGVFQFESPGMQKNLRAAQPGNIEDLVALNALYRPGPMQYIPQFINSKLGKQKIEYPHPELEELLKPTYGVIVYQEQVMKVAQIIAGYTLGAADILRRIMGKKKVDALAAEEVKFIEGAIKLGRTEKQAKEIFEMLKPFAGYGFNKSHAVAYSVVAYQTAFLKANYPAEFMAANLTNEMSNPDKFREYLALCKNMNINIKAPNINYSNSTFAVKDGDIIYGLSGIKGVGTAAIAVILGARKNGKFTDFIDFLYKIPSRARYIRVIEALIGSGALDCFGYTRYSLMFNLEKAIEYVSSKERILDDKDQGFLFGDQQEEIFEKFTMKEKDEYDEKYLLDKEKELIGFYVSAHPLDRYADKIKYCIITKLGEPRTIPLDKERKIIALVENINARPYINKRTGKENKMAAITLSDYTGSVTGLSFGQNWDNLSNKIEKDKVYAFKGTFKKRKDGDEISYFIDDVLDISTLTKDAIRESHIVLNKDLLDKTNITILYNIMLEFSGSLQTYLHLKEYSNTENGEKVIETIIELGGMYCTSANNKLKEELEVHPAFEELYYN